VPVERAVARAERRVVGRRPTTGSDGAPVASVGRRGVDIGQRPTYDFGWGMRTLGMSDPNRALGPEEAADRTFTAHEHDSGWLDAFTERLDRLRGGASFGRTIEVWGLSQADAARLFGVSRQAVGQWLRQGAPSDRAGPMADLSAATDLLVRHLERDRIRAVVRRPIPALGGESLVVLWGRGETRTVLAACRDMFRFDRAHG